MRLLYVFTLATGVVVAAVWALGEIDAWWVLVPAFAVYVLAASGVMHAVAQTLESEEESEQMPDAPALTRGPLRLGQLLTH
jgi:hypothetical protein